METLHLEGWLTETGGVELYENRHSKGVLSYRVGYVAELVAEFAEKVGSRIETFKHLGETHASINNVNMRLYVTNSKCSLEDATFALVDKLEGCCVVETSLCGYSEWTITGMDVDQFTIGGHDVERELLTYKGKYVHLVLEVR